MRSRGCCGRSRLRRTGKRANAGFGGQLLGSETARYGTYGEYLLPPLIRLDAAHVHTPERDERRLVELPGSLPSVHRIVYWRPLQSDSLELVWSTGFVGWALRLHVDGDTLRGRAEEIYDAGPGSVEPASAARFPCGAPIPPQHRRRWPRAPHVDLEGGTIVELRQPLSSLGIPVSPLGEHRYRLARRTSELLGGGDSLDIQVDGRNVIGTILVVYTDLSAWERIHQRLVALHGPLAEPADRPHDQPQQARGVAEWYDREIWAELRMDRARGHVTLFLADPRYMY